MHLPARPFLPAAPAGGLDLPAIGRHLPVFRRYLGTDAVLLVTRCTRPARPFGGYVLALTRNRLVVVQESRVVHRLRLHLDAPLDELSEVSWRGDSTGTTVELSATAIDGVRERFAIRRHPGALDRALRLAFGDGPPPLS